MASGFLETGLDRVEGVEGAVDREAGDGTGLECKISVNQFHMDVYSDSNSVQAKIWSKERPMPLFRAVEPWWDGYRVNDRLNSSSPNYTVNRES